MVSLQGLWRKNFLKITRLEHSIKDAFIQACGFWLPKARKELLPTGGRVDNGTLAYLRNVWAESVEATVIPVIREAAIAQAEQVHSNPLYGSSPEDWLEPYLASVRNRMVGTPDQVFRQIATDLQDGITRGEDAGQLAARVQTHLTLHDLDTYRGRANAVARTEAVAALNYSALAAAKVEEQITGQPLTKIWLATADSRTRHSHAASWGQRVALTAAFKVGAAHLQHPGDPNGPANEVIRCRCSLAVLPVGEELPAESDLHTERLSGRDSTARNRNGMTQAELIQSWADKGVVRALDDPLGIGYAASSDPVVTEQNWVEDTGGLPSFIKRIVKHLRAKNPGWTEGHAIAVAVNVAKRMCGSGDLNWPGKQEVNPKSRGEACAAVAEWEAKKARAKGDNGFDPKVFASRFIAANPTAAALLAAYNPNQPRWPSGISEGGQFRSLPIPGSSDEGRPVGGGGSNASDDDTRRWTSDEIERRQIAVGVPLEVEHLKQAEVLFLERFTAAGHAWEWLKPAWTPTNDIKWFSQDGEFDLVELKSTGMRYDAVQDAISKVFRKVEAFKRGNPGVEFAPKDKFIVDFGRGTPSAGLMDRLTKYNLTNPHRPLTALWVWHSKSQFTKVALLDEWPEGQKRTK